MSLALSPTRWVGLVRFLVGLSVIALWFSWKETEPWAGGEDFRYLEVRVDGDPRPTRSGRLVVDVVLEGVVDARGDEFGASGRGTLFAPQPISSGEQLRFVADGDLAGPWFPSEVSVRRRPARPSWRWAARNWVLSRLRSLGGVTGELLPALVLGIRSDAAHPVYFYFRQAGLIHILALSGLHMGVFGRLVRRGYRRLAGERGSFSVSLALMVAYLGLAGPRPGLVRAFLMALIGEFARRRGFRAHIGETLSLSLIIQSIVFPAQTQSLSFALSYAAIAGMGLVGELLSRVWALSGLGPRRALSVAVGAQFGVLPVLAAVGFGIQPEGLLLSLGVTPLAPWLLVTSLLYVACAGVPVLGAVLGWTLVRACEVLTAVAAHVGRVPPLWMSGTTALAILLGFILLLWAIHWRCLSRS